MKRKLIIALLLLPFILASLPALAAEVFRAGAQVLVEPWQNEKQLDKLFASLENAGMTVCRVRMFENYGTDIFDTAFDCAQKHGVKIFVTLFPDAPDNSVGGFKFPLSDSHEEAIKSYVTKTVEHFKDHPALLGWVLMNEPGTGGSIPDTEYSRNKYNEWLAAHPESGIFSRQEFLTDYNTWYLAWLGDLVRSIDNGHEIHVNNHAIFSNIAEYDFPAWRQNLTSLGASAHPSWHFGYFDRSRYGIAMAANCAMVCSGAGELPFWITELQGGTNTYSGNKAFCPTGSEIKRWMWTGIGTGASGLIFWCLNPRTMGEEAGEWSLLTLQGDPSERMDAAADVIKGAQALGGCTPICSPVTLLYFREALWAEAAQDKFNKNDIDYEGRQAGGVMKSVAGVFQLLSESGIQSRISEADEYDFSQEDYSGKTLILADQICVPVRYYDDLRSFVEKGGTLIVEGLSTYYDEELKAVHYRGFGLEDVFGGLLDEVNSQPADRIVKVGGRKLPIHLFDSSIKLSDGRKVNLSENSFGRGRVVWIPHLAALGAVRSGNYTPFRKLLLPYVDCSGLDFTFARPVKGVQMFTMVKPDGGKTVILINNSDRCRRVCLKGASRRRIRIKAGDVKIVDLVS